MYVHVLHAPSIGRGRSALYRHAAAARRAASSASIESCSCLHHTCTAVQSGKANVSGGANPITRACHHKYIHMLAHVLSLSVYPRCLTRRLLQAGWTPSRALRRSKCCTTSCGTTSMSSTLAACSACTRCGSASQRCRTLCQPRAHCAPPSCDQPCSTLCQPASLLHHPLKEGAAKALLHRGGSPRRSRCTRALGG